MTNDLRYRQFEEKEARGLNPLQLALIGDGVFEIFIRNYILSSNSDLSAHKIHIKAISYVKAKSQSWIMHCIQEELNEEETYIFKRGRNAKSATVPKNADVRDYRMATGFEALIGYLYLTGKTDRLNYFLNKSISIAKQERIISMTKRENPRKKEREYKKVQEKSNRFVEKKEKNKQEMVAHKVNSGELLRDDLVLGRNAVIESLKSDRTIECLYVMNGDVEGSIKVALGLARDKGVVVKEVDRRKLDSMCEGANHQGIVAKVTPFKYCEVNHIIQ